MGKNLEPMLAKEAVLDQLRYPLYASPKIDGIRCLIDDTWAKTRSFKAIPNNYVREYLEILFKNSGITGLTDGELVVGNAYDSDVYNRTNSGIMSHKGEPEFTYLVFDHYSSTYEREPFQSRMQNSIGLCNLLGSPRVIPWMHQKMHDREELEAYENFCLEQGYEGLILRAPEKEYKFGRSTMKEQGMLKMKRFSDSEAEVIGMIELLHNANEAVKDAFGRTERSSHVENKIGMNKLGAFVVRDIHHGWEFNVGGGKGLTSDLREKIWKDPFTIGKVIKYTYFAHGMLNVPRHPNFVGFRDSRDL